MSDKIIIYTDGACRGNQQDDNVGGWGAYIERANDTEEIYGGERNTTNNRMELQACIEALKLVQNTITPIEVYTDSAYLCNCINNKWYVGWRKNGWTNSKKKPVENKDLWVELLDLIENINDISLFKVKGHSGDIGNEKADELANRGADTTEREGKNTNYKLIDKYETPQVYEIFTFKNIDRKKTEKIFNNIKELGMELGNIASVVQNPGCIVLEDLHSFREDCKVFEDKYALMTMEVEKLFSVDNSRL